MVSIYFPVTVALGYGFLALGLAFLAGNLGGVLQAAIAVTSSVAGPLLAVFIMALFMPFTNSKVRDLLVNNGKLIIKV